MNKLGQLISCITLVWGFSASAHATSEDYKFLLPLRTTSVIRPYSRVRVKIFPHLKDYKPHGRDKVRGRIGFRSRGTCKSYRSHRSLTKASGPVLKAWSNQAFDVNDLSFPVYVKCNKPTSLVRSGIAASFYYTGDFLVRSVSKQGVKTLEVINVLSLRDYLKGVVPSEVYTSWPIETLKTQAVAARTYAVFHISFARRYFRKRAWDVDDTVAYQAYTGISLKSRRTDRAVNETKGHILTHGGRVIQAYYHADSGGQTEAAVDVWNMEIPYVQGRREAFDFEVPASSWQKKLSLVTVQRKLRIIGELSRRERLVSLSIPEGGRTDSGRVRTVRLHLVKGFKDIAITRFKKASGNLQSTLFAFESAQNRRKIVLKGLGSGHGVGMSQTGAAILAQAKGWRYDQILNYYYDGTELCSLAKRPGKLPDCYAKDLEARNDLRASSKLKIPHG